MNGIALALLLATGGTPPPQSANGLRQFIPPVPTPASFVSDQRRVLTDQARATLDARIRELQQGGFGDIAIAILPDIGNYTPNDIAVAIYRDWKIGSVAQIGSARRDVGVLLLIVPKELSPDKKGQCYIASGTGAEGIVTDAASGRQMHRLGEAEDDAHLDPGQVVEEQLKSVDYDVWECDCGEHLVTPYTAIFTSYSKCRECQRLAAKATRTVVHHATTASTGMARDNYRCQACQATWLVTVTLPMISTASGGSGSSGGGGGGGSSFGGSGSSSGGGGGSSY